MRFAIVYSKLDDAGKNIIEEIKKIAFIPQFPLIELKKETIYCDDLNLRFYPELVGVDFIVFASKHQSEKLVPSLSLHAPGNWRDARFGGSFGKLCMTSAFVLKYLFIELNKSYHEFKNELSDSYEVTLEVTHHGPLIDKPCCFVELGSSERQWNDKKAARIVARAIVSLENYPDNHFDSWIATLGVGGTHYCSNFNRIQLNSKYALSHIIPEYSLPLTESMLKEAEEKTKETVREVLIDWKGCGNSESRKRVISVVENLGFGYKKTSSVKN